MSKEPKQAAGAHENVDLDAASLIRSLNNRLIYSVGKDTITATERDWLLRHRLR
ncbi:MAG: hypothetical protein MZV65_54040 [Chromatiales bacterium]|nr:hypothetical protein [Chromatiales bacterium]